MCMCRMSVSEIRFIKRLFVVRTLGFAANIRALKLSIRPQFCKRIFINHMPTSGRIN